MELNDAEARFNERLPPEIVAALKRKSSRDPNSRFPRKLHMLLSYLATNPALEEEIGLSWINDTEFKMKKKNVALVMGIKLNTLNVNLRDLGFEQLQHDKGGWTQWKRTGFTRSSVFEDPANSDQPMPVPKPRMNPSKPRIEPSGSSKLMEIGHVMKQEQDNFREKVDMIWYKLTEQQDGAVPKDFLVEKAAAYFKQQEQPMDNAKEVIKAIMAPDEPTKTKADLYKFLAMFGPENTIMLKIASLLLISNNKGNWLSFDPTSDNQGQTFGSFDKNEPNCLVLKVPYESTPRRVWNHPLIEATGSYLTDETKRYDNWDKYFEEHPILDTAHMEPTLPPSQYYFN